MIYKSLLRQPGDIWAPPHYHYVTLKDWSEEICEDSQADYMHFPGQRLNYLKMYS